MFDCWTLDSVHVGDIEEMKKDSELVNKIANKIAPTMIFVQSAVLLKNQNLKVVGAPQDDLEHF